LPFLFGESYSALFMPMNLLNEDSIVRKLVNGIAEVDWLDTPDSENGVEIVGWLYQFYISERKDEVIGAKKKVEARDIPAATQLFTPHWIVRYMVENSLGRLWLEAHPESRLREKMPYFLESAPDTPHPPAPSPTRGEGGQETSFSTPVSSLQLEERVQETSPLAPAPLLPLWEKGLGDEGLPRLPQTPQELTVIDPACGSGHILVYAFDLLFEIYKEQGYLERDIPGLILAHNLHGLDIDERAVQLASFAVLMKARAKNARFLRKPVRLKVLTVKSTRGFDVAALELSGVVKLADWQPLLGAFEDADNLGSLITPPVFDADKLQSQIEALKTTVFLKPASVLSEILEQSKLLRKRYWVAVANPPYMGGKGMNLTVKNFAEKNYPASKSDLFAVFVERIMGSAIKGGFIGLMTPFTWMFLSSYEKLRKRIINENTLTSLIRPEYHAFFDSAFVPICTFTLSTHALPEYRGTYVDLKDFYGAELQPVKVLEAIENPDCGYLYYAKAADFAKIPGSPISYWIKNVEIFSKGVLNQVMVSGGRLKTHSNERFIRYKWEPAITSDRWKPVSKGGEFCKFYGNDIYVADWSSRSIKFYNEKGGMPPENFLNKLGICWSKVTSSMQSFRVKMESTIHESASPTIFFKSTDFDNSMLGFLNSYVALYFLQAINPTLNTQLSDVLSLPFIEIPKQNKQSISLNIKTAIFIAKTAWDNFETSWDFQTHPLLRHNTPSLTQVFTDWQQQSETAFQQLQNLEEENNRYWIEAYGLQDELTPEVPDDQITIRRADLARDIRSLISYAVGCMMGRYSLDQPGLIHAGQPFEPSRHSTFPADADAILPITDQAYFDDDIASRFIEFIKIAYSPATLTENLDFIANALELKTGETAQDRIRRYFVSEFISDHIKTYKKRPIYWLFTSGKKRAFSALIYLHRYTPDTIGRLRTDYVLELQLKLEKGIEQAQQQQTTASSTAAKKQAAKQLKTLQEQQTELRDYQAKLQTVADQRIELDLDDGVAYNYTRFEGLVYESSDLKMADLKAKAQWKIELLEKASGTVETPHPSPLPQGERGQETSLSVPDPLLEEEVDGFP
jgi:hypothetical protein